MQKNTSTYLYKYKDSSNYFFRIRYGNFDQMRYVVLKERYFVASLGTSNYDDARWLALYIRSNLKKDKHLMIEELEVNDANIPGAQQSRIAPAVTCEAPIGELTPFPADLSPQYYSAQEQTFKERLRQKFQALLKTGKNLIKHGQAYTLGALETISPSDMEKLSVNPDRFSSKTERASFIDAISSIQAANPDEQDEYKSKFVQIATMMNQLVALLRQEVIQHNHFEAKEYGESDKPALNDFPTDDSSISQEQFLTGMVDFQSLMPMFASLQRSIGEQETTKHINQTNREKSSEEENDGSRSDLSEELGELIKEVRNVANQSISLQQDQNHGSSKVRLPVNDPHFSLFTQMEAFLLYKKNEVAPKTLDKYKNSLAMLKELYPDDSDTRDWKKRDVQKVKAILDKRKAYDKESQSAKPLSVRTKNMCLSNLRHLFDWIISSTDVNIPNPFANADYAKPKGKARPPKRRSFTPDEVAKILIYKPLHGSEARTFREDARWYLKVCLYSGMRLNELSQLPLSNIRRVQDVWCFDLRGLSLKNEASERLIPIAQYLLDEGILHYVETLRVQNEKYFCPQIRRNKTKPGSAGWGDPISRWFNRTVIKNIGIDVEKEREQGSLICFHCTRRTFISTCVNNGAEKYLIKRLVGHSNEDDITLGTYSDVENIDLRLLKNVIDKNLIWHKAESA